MKKLTAFSVCLLLVAAVFFSACSHKDRAPRAKRVGLVYIAPHELINQITDGFRSELTKQMGPGIEILEKHANGDASQYSSTVAAVLGSGVDLIAPITTPIAQVALKQASKGVPVLFLGITDPIGAGLADSIERPARSTGVSDMAPFAAVVTLIRTLAPKTRTVGLPFSPGDQAAVFGKNELSRLVPAIGMELHAQAVTSQDDLPSILGQLARTCDVLLIGSDNAMFEAAPQIVKAGFEAHKPTFAGDSTSVKAGALGAYTINYREVGIEGARMEKRIFNGESAPEMPVMVMKTGVLELNLKTAEALGIQIPADLLAKAKTVIR
jgi:putative ABC transport system substrate-binding protein